MEERVYFESGRARVTSVSAKIGGTTFPISGITSVRMESTPAPMGAVVLLGIMGTMPLLVGVLMMFGDEKVAGIACTLTAIGVALFGLALVVYSQAKPSYRVVLGTAGAERAGLTTGDRELADEITYALETALHQRETR